jgi:hypothetical protein
MITVCNGLYWVSLNYANSFNCKKQYVKTLFRIPFFGRYVHLFKLQKEGTEKYNRNL